MALLDQHEVPPAPQVTLDQWRMLQAIVDAGSYAKAAEQLRKGQSTLSYAIQKMEQVLGVEVLVVKGRKAELTEAGAMLLRRSRYLVEEARAIEQAAQAMLQGWEAEVKVAVDQVFPETLWWQCLDEFAQVASNTRLDVLRSTLSGTQDAVVHKQVDLAVMGQVPPGFLSEFLITIPFALVVHPHHALNQLKQPISETDLRAHRQLVVRDTGARRRLDSGWLQAEKRWTVSDFHQSIALLRRNLGFAWLPITLVEPYLQSGELASLQFSRGAKSPAHLELVLSGRRPTGPATQALMDIIQRRSEMFRREGL